MASSSSHRQRTAPMARTTLRSRMVSSERLIAFSDAVIAIAITLLILDVRVPLTADLLADRVTLVQALLNHWPSYLSYAIGFVIIGEMWGIHHNMFIYIKRTDQNLLVINLFLLLFIAFIPFATALLSEYITSPERSIAVFVYGLTLTICSLFFNIIWSYVRRHPILLDSSLNASSVKGMGKIGFILMSMYALATLISWMSALVSIILYVMLAAMLLWPHPEDSAGNELVNRDDTAGA